jgi:hypothetical protein
MTVREEILAKGDSGYLSRGMPGFSRRRLGASSGTRCVPDLPQPSQVNRRVRDHPALDSSAEETNPRHAGQSRGLPRRQAR